MTALTPDELALQTAAKEAGVTAVIVDTRPAPALNVEERIRQLADEAAQLAQQFDANLPAYPKGTTS